MAQSFQSLSRGDQFPQSPIGPAVVESAYFSGRPRVFNVELANANGDRLHLVKPSSLENLKFHLVRPN